MNVIFEKLGAETRLVSICIETKTEIIYKNKYLCNNKRFFSLLGYEVNGIFSHVGVIACRYG